MSKYPSLKVEKRSVFGRKVKKLRREGILPANVFGNDVDSVAVQIDANAFSKLFAEVGETGLIELTIAGESKARPVLVANVHVKPSTGQYLHADLHQVNLKEKVTATVPVELVGEAPAVKDFGGILVTSVNELEVEALPTDLPEAITIDVSVLKDIGDSVIASELKLDREKLTLTIDPEETIVAVQEPKAEEIEEPAPTEEGDEATSEATETETSEAEAKSAETSAE